MAPFLRPLQLRPPLPTARARRGFTILELLVLMVIITVGASVGIPAYFGRPEITLQSAAELLAQDIREVQNRAALYEEELWLRFAEDGSGYRATDRAGQELISPYGSGPFQRRYPYDAVFRGVTIERVEPRFPGAAVFDARGLPRGPVQVEISYQGESMVVSMSGRGGMVTIEGDEAR